MNKIQFPSVNECFQLFDRYGMLDNIRAHSQVVAMVAEELVDGLAQHHTDATVLPDKQQVIAGALLHDIAKTLCLETGCRHAETGQQMLEALGWPELGEIVAEHVVLKEFRTMHYKQGYFHAKEIVYYADKRVRHDQIVTLDERLEYIIDRYGNKDPLRIKYIRLNFQKTQELESYLFSHLSYPPAELAGRMPRDRYSSVQVQSAHVMHIEPRKANS